MNDIDMLRLHAHYRRIDQMMREKGVLTDEASGRKYYTGYDYKTLYDWDQYFEAIVQLYMGWDTSYIKNGVAIFLSNQREDGFIYRSVPRATNSGQGDEHVKPFLAQIALLVYKREKQLAWIGPDEYARLKKYLSYWMGALDKNHNSLSTWDSAPHTGMDNQHERAGYWYDCFCEGVDLNCFLIRECRAMAQLARILGETADAQEYDQHAERIARAVGELWDEQDGIFYDRNEKTGDPIKIKYVGAFATLWAGVATEAQARRMIERYLSNPNEFWRAFPLPAYAASEKGYVEGYLEGDLGCNWRAYTWIPTNYYVFQGLRRYGYAQLAEALAVKTFEMVEKIGDREYYTSDSCKGAGLNPFWGWSLLAYFMPLEAQLGYDPTGLSLSAGDAANITVL